MDSHKTCDSHHTKSIFFTTESLTSKSVKGPDGIDHRSDSKRFHAKSSRGEKAVQSNQNPSPVLLFHLKLKMNPENKQGQIFAWLMLLEEQMALLSAEERIILGLLGDRQNSIPYALLIAGRMPLSGHCQFPDLVVKRFQERDICLLDQLCTSNPLYKSWNTAETKNGDEYENARLQLLEILQYITVSFQGSFSDLFLLKTTYKKSQVQVTSQPLEDLFQVCMSNSFIYFVIGPSDLGHDLAKKLMLYETRGPSPLPKMGFPQGLKEKFLMYCAKYVKNLHGAFSSCDIEDALSQLKMRSSCGKKTYAQKFDSQSHVVDSLAQKQRVASVAVNIIIKARRDGVVSRMPLNEQYEDKGHCLSFHGIHTTGRPSNEEPHLRDDEHNSSLKNNCNVDQPREGAALNVECPTVAQRESVDAHTLQKCGSIHHIGGDTDSPERVAPEDPSARRVAGEDMISLHLPAKISCLLSPRERVDALGGNTQTPHGDLHLECKSERIQKDNHEESKARTQRGHPFVDDIPVKSRLEVPDDDIHSATNPRTTAPSESLLAESTSDFADSLRVADPKTIAPTESLSAEATPGLTNRLPGSGQPERPEVVGNNSLGPFRLSTSEARGEVTEGAPEDVSPRYRPDKTPGDYGHLPEGWGVITGESSVSERTVSAEAIQSGGDSPSETHGIADDGSIPVSVSKASIPLGNVKKAKTQNGGTHAQDLSWQHAHETDETGSTDSSQSQETSHSEEIDVVDLHSPPDLKGKFLGGHSPEMAVSEDMTSRPTEFNTDDAPAIADEGYLSLAKSKRNDDMGISQTERVSALIDYYTQGKHLQFSPHECQLPTIGLQPVFPQRLPLGALELDFRSPVREAMVIESFRLSTFLYCPDAAAMSALRLANAGFYYTGRDGLIACYSCDVTCHLQNGGLQHDPYQFHLQQNPRCPHMNNIDPNHEFIQDDQRRARRGRDITGGQVDESQRQQSSLVEITATIARGLSEAYNTFLRNVEAVPPVRMVANPSERTSLGDSQNAHEHVSTATVGGQNGESAWAGPGGGRLQNPVDVPSTSEQREGAGSTATATTNASAGSAQLNATRQGGPEVNNTVSDDHSRRFAANDRGVSSTPQHRGNSLEEHSPHLNTLNRSRSVVQDRASRGAHNSSAPQAASVHSGQDVPVSSGGFPRGGPGTGAQGGQVPTVRQASSPLVNGISDAHVSTLLNGEQGATASSGRDASANEGNSRLPSNVRLGLLGGSANAQVYTGIITNAPAAGLARQVTETTPPGHTGPSLSESGYDRSRAVHPRYTDLQRRERSFGGWPDTHAQSPEELATAGFFYAGTGDCVRCHYCGLGLKHWDPDDRPLDEHVRWRSSCGYLRALLGEEEIGRILARLGGSRNGTSGRSENSQAGHEGNRPPQENQVASGNAASPATPDRNQEVQNLLTTEVATAAREMGFSDELIRQGIRALLATRAGRRAVTPQNLVHAILYLRERGQRPNSPPSTNPNIIDVSSDSSDDDTGPPPPTPRGEAASQARPGENHSPAGCHSGAPGAGNREVIVYNVAPNGMGSQGADGTSGSARPPQNTPASSESRPSPDRSNSSTQGPVARESIRQLEQENQELRERRRCKICLDNDVGVLFLPCGHLVCCPECAPALRRCPMCRKRITGTVPIQFSAVPNGAGP